LTAKLRKVVIDTNIFLSAFLNPSSVPAKAIEKTLRECTMLRSLDTWVELESILSRNKFDRYRSKIERHRYFEYLTEIADEISVMTNITACRDPKDDKFLALAIDGLADVLITGDQDLLALHPFRGVRILTPADFLAL
jgi:putative PIN family toxin of toxin-antitoxin system